MVKKLLNCACMLCLPWPFLNGIVKRHLQAKHFL